MEATITMKKFDSEPKWLTSYREKNFDKYLEKPTKKSMCSDIEKLDKLLEKAKENNENNLVSKVDGFKVLSWSEALNEFPEKLKEIIEKEIDATEQYEAFINASFMSGNVFVIETDGFFEIETTLKEFETAKNIFIIKSNVQDLNIIENIKGKIGLYNTTFYFEEASKGTILRIPDFETNLMNAQIIAQKDSEVTATNIWMNGDTKSNYINYLIGDGSSINQNDVLLLNDKQYADIKMVALHKGRASHSKTTLKNALKGQSVQAFDGLIKILKPAQETYAYLEANSMLLSDEAKSVNIPKLEIEPDNVKATHAATVEHVEPEKLFYLQTRGLEESGAIKIVIESFLESTTSGYNDKLKNKIIECISEKMVKWVSKKF